MPDQKAAKKKPAPPHQGEAEHATVPVRVSPTVHNFIISKAKWGESINRTLMRLLRIGIAGNGGRP